MPGVKTEPATERGQTQTRGIEWPNFNLGWDHNAPERDASGNLGPKKMYFAEIHLQIPLDGRPTLVKLEKAADDHNIEEVRRLLIAQLPGSPGEPAYEAKKAMIEALSFWT